MIMRFQGWAVLYWIWLIFLFIFEILYLYSATHRRNSYAGPLENTLK